MIRKVTKSANKSLIALVIKSRILLFALIKALKEALTFFIQCCYKTRIN